MIVYLRMQNAECRMQNEGIPSGDKIERSDKGTFSPGNQEICSHLPACFIHPEGIPSFCIQHFAFCIRSAVNDHLYEKLGVRLNSYPKIILVGIVQRVRC